ncbi:MAG: di-trans,poly-cis-decaprenylcistransferase [Proteobacteria bacterium]|nr:di-trans,poly-cis-decaprenylcistransferase [Pseudomonadota bacterium]MBS0464691.1 di-trans,poly-cis-decaprenylcistransferase [Pseudomonadota bacterium]
MPAPPASHPPPAPEPTAAGGGRVPQHIAIVMDGNGRWAQRRGRPRTFGHRAGAKTVRLCVRFCLERGIRALTLFAFSSENWKRPQEEVGALMNLFMRSLDREVDELHEHGVRLRFIGERAHLSAAIGKRMDSAERRTAGNTALHLNVAISYGGRWDIVQAARTLAQAAVRGQLDPSTIDEALFAQHVELAEQPAPDLFIRTGGDRRISNFLLWQMAYTELWFTDTLWPDLDVAELDRALVDFAARERRFGRTGAQVAQVGGA